MTIRVALRLTGPVQGVGCRPAVARAARAHGLSGWVANTAAGVSAELQGEEGAVEACVAALAGLGAVERSTREVVPESGFAIRPSSAAGVRALAVTPDRATCAACLREFGGDGRRGGYGLVACASCGPRWTLTAGLPFDRDRTGMAGFPVCRACGDEYADEGDRRHHAQTIACPACGPRLSWNGQTEGALAAATAMLRGGGLIAARGVGGYHLLCRADDAAAVARLRAGKRRPDKPLAVLVIGELPGLTVGQRALLDGADAPVVLVERARVAEVGLADGVAPGRRRVGLLRAPSAMHAALAAVGPLVCTSGNVSGEPLCVEVEDAEAQLGFVDGFLHHDRPILRPVDESVVDGTGGPIVLRAARGRAPQSFDVAPGLGVVALGAHLDACACVATDAAVVAPWVGDLDRAACRDRLEAQARGLAELLGAEVAVVACDAHPDLGSRELAERLAADWGATVVGVPHHEAHVAAVLAEHRWDGPALGLAWDGMGRAADGTWQGGEALRWDGAAFRRTAALRSLRLIGGAAAIREPGRLLVAAAQELGDPSLARRAQDAGMPVDALSAVAERGTGCVDAGSVGRLFDLVAALLGGPLRVSHRAQAAEWLQERAEEATVAVALPLPIVDGLGDWRPLVAAVAASTASVPALARGLHEALVRAAVECVETEGASTATLSGGCFGNRLLRDGVVAALEARGVRALTPQALPAGDGGLALGQAWWVRRSAAVELP